MEFSELPAIHLRSPSLIIICLCLLAARAICEVIGLRVCLTSRDRWQLGRYALLFSLLSAEMFP